MSLISLTPLVIFLAASTMARANTQSPEQHRDPLKPSRIAELNVLDQDAVDKCWDANDQVVHTKKYSGLRMKTLLVLKCLERATRAENAPAVRGDLLKRWDKMKQAKTPDANREATIKAALDAIEKRFPTAVTKQATIAPGAAN